MTRYAICCRLLITISALLVAGHQNAFAQRAVFIGDNDAVGRTDRDYSAGFRASVVFDDFSHDLFAKRAFDFVKPGLFSFGAPSGPVRQQFEWIAIGQSIYTPDKISQPVHAPTDRPFGGWLYGGFSVAQESARRQLDTFEVLAGAVGGSASLAGETQSGVHRLLGQRPPAINGFDVRNQAGFQVTWDRKWKFGHEFGNAFGVDIIPSVSVTGGNVVTDVSAGAIVRAGQSLSTTWGPTMIRPAAAGSSFISPDTKAPFWGYDFFAGATARGVARNVFIDNASDAGSIIKRKSFVYDLIAGAELFMQNGYRIAFTAVQRSKEYDTQTKSSIFGSIEASIRF